MADVNIVTKSRTVSWDSLVLDPNNPRFITHKEDWINDQQCLQHEISGKTKDRICPDNDKYRIKELVKTIRENKWLPVDCMFVRRMRTDAEQFLVLEGNRRLAAIREIMIANTAGDSELIASLENIEVMEVLSPGTDAELQKHITYLLGVRHHGSLVKWSPFAQARNIFVRYLEDANQSPESFKWNERAAQKVADMLSIDLEEVKNRLKIYRVMFQAGNVTEVKLSETTGGGMKDSYYSVCGEPLLSPRQKLKGYLQQDPVTFLLAQEGLDRLTNLCKFTIPKRSGAAMKNPQEWIYLDKILADDDQSKKEINLIKVEKEGELPSNVWAARAKELYAQTWEKWLFDVNATLSMVTLGGDMTSDTAKSAVKRLADLLDELQSHNKN